MKVNKKRKHERRMPRAESSAKRYVMTDGDALSKFFMLGAITHDERSRAIHHSVAWHLLERWYERWGNGQASVGYLQKATGLTRGSVATATADLCSWGYFRRTMGSGKRPTSYVPNWKVARVLWLSDSGVLQSQDVMSVLQSPDTLVLPRKDGKPGCVLQPPEESHLPNPLTSGVTVDTSSGAASARLAPASRTEDVEGKISAPRVEGREIAFELGGMTVRIVYEHDDQRLQEIGQEELSSLAAACGLRTIESGHEIAGKAVVLLHLIDGETSQPYRRFRAMAANDNEVSFADNAAQG